MVTVPALAIAGCCATAATLTAHPRIETAEQTTALLALDRIALILILPA